MATKTAEKLDDAREAAEALRDHPEVQRSGELQEMVDAILRALAPDA